LPVKMPRSGERRWRSEDLAAAGGDEVSARRGDVAERADDGLLLRGALDLARHHVGRERRATRAVDAHHDGADACVIARALNRGHERLHAGEAHVEDRDGRRLAVDDVAVDE
jgi:hypothetical protein